MRRVNGGALFWEAQIKFGNKEVASISTEFVSLFFCVGKEGWSAVAREMKVETVMFFFFTGKAEAAIVGNPHLLNGG